MTEAPSPAVPHSLRECPCCGFFSHIPRLEPGTDARCPRCGGVLRRERRSPLDRALGCVIAALMFYALAVGTTFLEVDLHGQRHLSTMETGPMALEQQGYLLLGFAVLLFTVLMPLAKLGVMLLVLVGLRLPTPPWWLHVPFRWLERIAPWSMVEVYLLGVFVAYTRLVSLAEVHIETAAYALAGLMLAMAAADAALDPETVWEELERRQVLAPAPHFAAREARLIGCETCHRVNNAREGEHCGRCGSVLRHRKPASLSRTWALLTASAILYIPANAYVVMSVTRLGQENPYTILGGAGELLEAGLWPLAALVFFASVLVPMVKLAGLAAMLVATGRGSAWRLLGRTKLYRAIDFIGRWSMIDVFMISILVSLMQFGQLASIRSGPGAAAFACVVILTMFASHGFDPRLMWDVAAPAEADITAPSTDGAGGMAGRGIEA